ncbi:NAD(P)(+) transhydrogenase (Re/Si-specific) subunit beta [Paraburkholderia sp. MMS20-SJTR3]|uniref:NAD(P)(+) transhydrogenase (Re/Si-specific) subunit beta n=1 Tax=Paraburkholderia sejongensis TaxID=2886946 RepID=A0ABS8JY47_9BURK|nr:NAD(P)(+) transhydrogenase (Re/Si-specific) subunit beta [Paraburkholderia sp. MMS20-SJTR3]MCC8394834.1 NAD(P)(+) transhydrogenase (Re/Si-specific) subunit beta [Paraburkholderia sp. MMS20-SJTR3]
MLQACGSTVWMDLLLLLAVTLAAGLGAVLLVALVALGQRVCKWRATRRLHGGTAALAALLAGSFAAGLGARSWIVGAALAGALLGALRMRGRNPARWPALVALLGSGMGLAVVSIAVAHAVSPAARDNTERLALCAAVFIGALIFAQSSLAFCKLRGTLQIEALALPGHHLVNLLALLLCGWLGYSFATEPAQLFGLAELLAMSALAAAIGAHLMISREYLGPPGHAMNGDACTVYAFAARSDGMTIARPGLLESLAWHGGEDCGEVGGAEPMWALRDLAPGTVRASAYPYRRGLREGRRVFGRQRDCTRVRQLHVTAAARRAS